MIETKELRFAYPADEGGEPVFALQGVDLTIEKGSFVVVLGHNGSGKSTLAKTLNAVLLPSGGKVYVEGMDTLDENLLLAIRQRVGMIFQNPDNQIVATVVEEDVAFALENIGVPPQEIRERIDRAMKDIGIYQHREKGPHQLSGGQKQRVAIAGIIAMRPDCIVLDEPTAMLDPYGRAMVIETIKKLNRDFGITVVLITHYMNEAAQADRVVVMSKGKIEKTGTPKEIFSQVDWVKSLALDVPQTAELAHEINRHGFSLSTEAISIDECAAQLYRFLEE